MERMRFICSNEIDECRTWVGLANCQLNVQANDMHLRSIGLPLPQKGRGEGEGRDLLRQMTHVALEPLTSVLSPSRGGEATERASGIRPEMDLTT
jgi:hypothetical protein